MRKSSLALVLLAAALLLQLTVVNGLHLPRGGVPDLVLVLVVALAIADGPVRGMVTGFAAGLCLDLAPPGSGLIGLYALVFCLAGWAAGRLGRVASRWPLRALVLAAAVIAAAEAITAALGLLLEPAEVTSADVRQFLPVTIGYDLLLCPFALYLVLLAGALLAGARLADGVGGTARAWLLAAPARPKRAVRERRPHEPRLAPAAARTGDGWVGGSPAGRTGARPPARRPARLHPGTGVAGSASGLVRHRDRPVTAVNLRLSAGRRSDTVIGSVVGREQGQHRRPSQHPGSLTGASGQFRPHGGELGGSAARQRAPAGPGPRRVRINFGAHRGDASAGRGTGPARLGVPAPGARVRSPRLPMGGSRSALTPSGRSGLATAVPRVRFQKAAPPVARPPAAAPKFRRSSKAALPVARPPAAAPKFRRSSKAALPVARPPAAAPKFRRSSRAALPVARPPAAAPKFRRSPRLRSSTLTSGLVARGVLDQGTFRARRTAVRVPRLRLAGGGPGGMLGGSGRSALRRPSARVRKQPRFGYGRRSLLSILIGRHIGGRWLASRRAGGRSGVWLIGRGTGGVR